MNKVGIIGDLHIPFDLDGYLKFCKRTFKKAKCNKIIMIGDLLDHHALSFHENEPTLRNAAGELIDAREALKPWYRAFPKLTLCLGNHDLIPKRQLKKIGMDGDAWLRPLGEIYNFPKGWDVVDEITIDNVLYHHGYTANGQNGFRQDAIKRMCRTVSGHAHGNAGVSATASEHRLVWGMAVGCGIDVKQMAFAYGRHFLQKPIISCGVVINGELPIVHFMDLGEGP